MKNKNVFLVKEAALTIVAFIWSLTARASSTTSLPWDSPMQTLVNSLTGPVLLGISILAVMLCGLMLAYGDFSSTGKRIVSVVMGISLACAAPSVVVTWFHFSGAVI